MPTSETRLIIAAFLVGFLPGCAALPEGGERVVRTDHYVTLKSSAPGLAGANARIYVREISPSRSSAIPRAHRVVLFLHGGGPPGTSVFDLPLPDYSWMRHLANAGYDTFAMDFTGFGQSTRPTPMNDPCNLPEAQQKVLVPAVLPVPCKPSFPHPITTMESEWEEIDAVVEHLRRLRNVDRVAIVAWSRGGPRIAGYLLRHPQKISRVFAFAPDYHRDWPLQGPKSLPNGSMVISTKKGGEDFWATQVGCQGQIEPGVADVFWKDSLSSDPLGAGWGVGVRRGLPALGYGINKEASAAIRVPFALVAGPLDKVVSPSTVRAFFEDLGSTDKLFVDLACLSHYGMWEKNRALLFNASLHWIRDGKVNGVSRGETRLGY